jgi:ribosomal silencing factor RsfS
MDAELIKKLTTYCNYVVQCLRTGNVAPLDISDIHYTANSIVMTAKISDRNSEGIVDDREYTVEVKCSK